MSRFITIECNNITAKETAEIAQALWLLLYKQYPNDDDYIYVYGLTDNQRNKYLTDWEDV